MKRSREDQPIVGKTINEHGPPPQRILLPKPAPVSNNNPKIFAELAKRFPAKMMQRVKARGDKPVRVYADGIFDMFHYAHARALQQAKTAFPNAVLIVGCCSDPLTHALKGQTVLQDEERYSSLRHCRHVDELIENAPWVLNDEFLDEHDIDFVAHDALPYTDSSGSAGDSGDIYAHIKQQGRFLETKRTTGVSTTELIVRIIKRYDDFISRNVKRGYSLDDMDVPLLNRVNHAASAAIDAAAAVVRTAGKNAQILQKRLQDRLEKNAAEFQERFVKVFEPLQQRERNQHAKAAGRMATPSPTGAGAAAAGAAGGSESSDSAGDLPEADIVAVSPRGRKLARKR